MKKATAEYVVIVVFLLACINNAHGKWKPVNGVWGETVNKIVVCGNSFFVSARGGVFRLSDNGTTWTSCNEGLPPTVGDKIAVSGDTIYAASEKLYRSTDYGETWSDVNAVPAPYFVYSLGVMGKTLMMSLMGLSSIPNIISFTTDNGKSWNEVDSSLERKIPGCYAVSGSAFLFGGFGGIYRSIDNGSTWDSVHNAPVNTLVAKDAVVLAGTWGNEIWRSTDNGLSWSKVFNCMGTGMVGDFVFLGNKVIAGSTFGTYCSFDTGKTWEAAGYIPDAISSFSCHGSIAVAGTDSGIFLSTDNGESWNANNAGLAASTITSLAVSGNNVIAGTTNGIYFSGNNGTDWSGSDREKPIFSLTVMKDKVFAGLGRYPLDCVYDMTTRCATRMGGVLCGKNDGTTWSYVASSGLPNETNVLLQTSNHYDLTSLAVQDSTLFGVYNGWLYRSDDYGARWSSASRKCTAILASDDDTLFAGDSSGVFRSTDKGDNWIAVSSGLTHMNVLSLTLNDSHVFAGTSGGGVFRSGDKGENWVTCNSGLTDTVITALAVHDDALFAGTRGNGVFLSTDNGLHWTDISGGLSINYPVTSFAVHNDVLFLGTCYTGLWQRPLSEMPGVVNAQPRRLRHDQIQSNKGSVRCAGSIVTVGFTLLHSDKATVEVYDMTGRVVASLVNRHLEAGAHQYSCDTRMLTKGCYMVRVQAGATAFGKMIRMVY